MLYVQVLWKEGDPYKLGGFILVHLETRLRIGCHCGTGLCVDVPDHGTSQPICPDCKRWYSVNFKGDVYCPECQDKRDQKKMSEKHEHGTV